MEWIVLRNTGDRAFLGRSLELKEVDRPKAMSEAEFRELLPVASSVDDEMIAFMTHEFR